jgi:hypothetical protein
VTGGDVYSENDTDMRAGRGDDAGARERTGRLRSDRSGGGVVREPVRRIVRIKAVPPDRVYVYGRSLIRPRLAVSNSKVRGKPQSAPSEQRTLMWAAYSP